MSTAVLFSDSAAIFAVVAVADAAATTAEAAATTNTPWWVILLDSAFSLTILLIFVTAVITTLISQRRRDKCLRLMDDYHVTYVNVQGQVLWGDLVVYPKGLELRFDAPFTGRNGIEKASALIYENNLANCMAICRPIDALTATETKQRQRQIRNSFRPGLWRRSIRALRNLANTLQDALAKAFNTLVGELSKRSAQGKILAAQKSDVQKLGQTVLGAMGNAYEPVLERQIGKPVVVQVQAPAAPESVTFEIPGYLAEYTSNFVAVFNVVHEPYSDHQLEVVETTQGPGFHIEWSDDRINIACCGPEVVVVKSITTISRQLTIECALPWGASVAFSTDGGTSVTVHLRRTRRVDLVLPRQQAEIYYGGEFDDSDKRRDLNTRTSGVAPEACVAADDEPAVVYPDA